MIDEARKCLAFLNRDMISEGTGDLKVIELSASGAGEVSFYFDVPAIKIRPPKDGKDHLFKALQDRKCADGAFISFEASGPRLHLVELKGRISPGDWPDILKQFEGMFLVSMAVLRVLNFATVSEVICYVAAKKDKMGSAASPILSKMPVGGRATFGASEQWHAELVDLPLGHNAKLVKGWRDLATGDYDFGKVA